MNRLPVASSNIRAVGYDPHSHTLEIEFANGRVYQYFDVPENVYKALLNAMSVGEYFNGEVRGVYRFARA